MPFDQEILNIMNLIQTGLEQVQQPYYRLQTMNGLRVRERVFCYELYHQMRNYQQDRTFSIHGEIDKRGNTQFRRTDRKNPDFVFHVPGEMSSNSVVVEVKGKINPTDVVKDFRTLHLFTSDYEYSAGVFLLYNHTFDELKRRMRESDISQYVQNSKIIILCKRNHYSGNELYSIRELVSNYQ